MDKNQLDNRIEAFMARKMKQFPEIGKLHQTKTHKSFSNQITQRPQAWLLSLGAY